MGDERGRGGLPKGERTQVNPIFLEVKVGSDKMASIRGEMTSLPASLFHHCTTPLSLSLIHIIIIKFNCPTKMKSLNYHFIFQR